MKKGPGLIRRASLEDMEEVVNIENSSFDDPWSRELFLNDLYSDHADFLVYEKGGKVVGFIVCYVVMDEVEIANIAVSPICRRENIGRQLLDKIISSHPGCTFYLEVLHTNSGAIAFYKNFGFEIVGLRKNYYGKDKDAILMKLKIKGVNYA